MIYYGIEIYHLKKLGEIIYMKKKLLIATSLVMAVGLTALTGCSSAVSTSFSANWYKNTSLSTNISGTDETLVYKVEYDGSEKTNGAYTLNYENGVYTTRFTNTTYTWSDGSVENVYSYTTSFSVDITYTVNGESATYTDSVTSNVIFRACDKSLTPIKSEKTVSSHSPAKNSPESLEEAVAYYNYTFVTQYDKEVGSANLTYTKLAGDTSSLKDNSKDFAIADDYSYLDNEQLLLAIRGMDMGSSASETVLCLNASTKAVQAINVSNSAVSEGEFKFNLDGVDMPENGHKLTYNEVSVAINSVQSGTAQTCYFAERTSAENNVYRNVMLYMSAPLPYSLGSLTYTLTDADFSDK